MRPLLPVLALALLVLLAVAASVQSRMEYDTFAFWGEPERIQYCGRRYYRANEVRMTPQQLVEHNSAYRTWETVGHTLTRRSIEGPTLPAGSSVCTMSLYVRTGEGTYRSYGLSGSP